MIKIVNKKNKNEIFSLNQTQSIFFMNCKDCIFNIPNKINKIIVYNCENIRLNINSVISSFEIIKSSKLYVLIYGLIMTTQIDLVKNSNFHYLVPNGYVISSGADNVNITTPYNNLILPFNFFLNQYITSIKTFQTKTREECLDNQGYLLLN